jgi:acetyltransferase-like isoleucine patch superfamily enzyme
LGEENVRDSIRIILLTNQRERLRLPEFGGNLGQFLFEPNTVTTRHQIQERISRTLAQWEPRVAVESVTVEPDPADVQSAIATIQYRLVATQARERVSVGDDVVLGRGSLIENDTTIGSMTKIQAEAYITAYSTLEDNVFIAPCVVTTNDNWMGRTDKRLGNVKGPTIRRGARVGGGAILCPGVEIGEEAFVGAGAVVTKDVPSRVVVVGSPARILRDVPEDELLPGAPSGS